MRSLMLIVALAAALPAVAGKLARFDCDRDVCGFNVPAREIREAPCRGLPVLVAYSESSGATLIQCGVAHGPEDTTTYLFDRASTGGAGLELAGTRFIKPDALAQAAERGVPDRFGPVPLCARPEPAAAVAGEFVLLAKMPAPDAGGAYCYRVIHAGARDGALALRAESGEPPAAAPTAHKKWGKLAARMLRQIPSHGASQQSDTGRQSQKSDSGSKQSESKSDKS